MCGCCVSYKVSETGLSRVTSGSSLLSTQEECFDSAKVVLKFPRIVPSLHTSNKKVIFISELFLFAEFPFCEYFGLDRRLVILVSSLCGAELVLANPDV